jgi:hypothetical protein
MVVGKARAWLGACTLALAAAACGGAAAPAAVAPSTTKRAKPVNMRSPSRLIPEIDTSGVDAWFDEEGIDKHLVAGLRIVSHQDGRVERANRRFSRGAVQAVVLPERLGGGYLFYQADGQGTRLWRAASWTAELEGVTFIGKAASGVLVGFDRLYVRLHDNEVLAIDPSDGEILPLGPLPPAAGYGAMTFADGWRGVVDTALRGPLASFDAGATWWPLGVSEEVEAAATLNGDPVLYVPGGYYRLDAQGHLQLIRNDDDEAAGDASDDREPQGESAESVLGRRPLRVAVTQGFPVGKDAAVVARRGSLVRVSLPDGRVTSMTRDALRDQNAECAPARVGAGDGFVCGVERGPTTIYRFVPPLSLVEVARFEEPRFVSQGGTGALAVRGPCGLDASSQPDMRTYCVVGKGGDKREVAVRGEIGAERVVALDDGRTVVLVPPRLGRPGRVTVIDGSKLTSAELVYPDEPRRAVKVARRGLWLEGFQQRGKKAIGGWVEAGGPVVGVTVQLDGKVKVGELREEGGDLLASGSLAVVVGDVETAFETTDGGESWNAFALPTLVESNEDAPSRGCSRVGCALRGWIRSGWGKPADKDDLATVDDPPTRHVRSKVPPTMQLSCGLVGDSEPRRDDTIPPERSVPFGGWEPFLGYAPPRLGKDDLGVGRATGSNESVPAQALAWGGRGADWTKSGWWQLRFDDRFATRDSMRRSARTRAPWSDETAVADYFGTRRRGRSARWNAVMDPGGRSAIVSRCMGTSCQPYAVSAGRPVLPLTTVGTSPVIKLLDQGAVLVGDSWYLLTAPTDDGFALWRSSLGTLRPAAELRRLDPQRYPSSKMPRLVRRVHGDELGLLVEQPPDPSTGAAAGRWLVLPLDLDGEQTIGEPIDLGRSDLEGKLPRACAADDDGWLVVATPRYTPSTRLDGASGRIESMEIRLRLEPGASCVDSAAARTSRRGLDRVKDAEPTAVTNGFDLAVRERSGGHRWHFRCKGRD